jgi:hypothetical protein
MSKAEDYLKSRVILILRSTACLNIQFTIVGSTVMGYGYASVADMIEHGDIGIQIGDTGSFPVRYTHQPDSSPTLTFGSGDPTFASSPSGRAKIVHEATHAVIDTGRKSGAIAGGGDDEVAAYLAQTIYALNAGDAPNQTGPLAGPVYQTAHKIKNFAGPGIYVVNPDEIAGAKPLILARFAGIARTQAAPTDVIVQSVAPPSVPIVPE